MLILTLILRRIIDTDSTADDAGSDVASRTLAEPPDLQGERET